MGRFTLLVLLALHGTGAAGQVGPLLFARVTPQEGLSQSWVRAIHQDDLGYMWFGTADGLNRFDGREMRVFLANGLDPNGLPHSSVNHIMRRNASEMWVCTELGVAIYNKDREEFRPFPHLRHLNVKTCLQDRLGYTWFGTTSGLFRFNPRDSSMAAFRHQPDNPQSISNDWIHVLYEDSFGQLWVGTQHGLNLFRPESQTFTRYLPSPSPHSIVATDVWDIAEDPQGRLWIGVARAGLNLLVNYREAPQEGHFVQVLPGSVNRLLVENGQRLWVGKGGGGGLTIIDLSSVGTARPMVYRHYAHTPGVDWGLSDNSIASLFLDRAGDVWVGTFGGGVNHHSPRAKQFFNYGVVADHARSISAELVNAFLDEGPYLWVGTEMGLDRFDRRTGTFTRFASDPNNPKTLGGNNIYAIHRDSRGNLWVGAWGGGISRFEPRTQTFRRFMPGPTPGSISSANVFAIHEDSGGTLWVGTIGGGLNRFNYSTGQFSVFASHTTHPQRIHNHSVNDILETTDGALMLTVYSALDVFDPHTNTFTHFVHDPADTATISGGFTLSLFEDSRGNVWVATNMGLNLFHRATGRFTRYTTAHGLPNNTIQAILEDDHGNLWISTNRGIAKFIQGAITPLKPRFRVFSRSDGLPSDEFTVRAATRDARGWMYFGSSNGFTMFHPDSIRANPLAPQVIFTQFNLIALSPGAPSLALPSRDINSLGEIRLTHRQNSFAIHYAALNYLKPQKNRYRVKLAGHQAEWLEVGNQRVATYTNMAPGRYTFMVLGSNNDGVWSAQPQELRIVITPPWWGTLAFRLSLMLLVALGIAGGVAFRFRMLQRQRKLLEAKVRERTHELTLANSLLAERQHEISAQNEELSKHRSHLELLIAERTVELERALEKARASDKLKTAFLANMSHEIRTPMNAIVGFSALLSAQHLDEVERKRYIEIITGNSEALLVLINDILDVAQIEANELVMDRKWFSPRGILLELEHYYQLNNGKGLEIALVQPPDQPDLHLYNDPVRFRQVASNLLSNAYKYTDAGHIHFGYKVVDNQAEFHVADTGVGIDPSQHQKIFNHFYKIEDHDTKLYRGTGIGLSISKKLVELMGGRIWLESSYGSGSVFFFALPLAPGSSPPTRVRVPRQEQGQAHNLSGITILVAEDEPANFMLLDRILTHAGARVVWAKNGFQAVEFFRTTPPRSPCLVLMDLKMPVMDGYQALRLIKEIDSAIPIVAVTAYAQPQDEQRVMAARFDGYLAKPIRAQLVLKTIAQLIAPEGKNG